MVTRIDGRAFEQLRPVQITRNYIKYAEGSVLIEAGDTRVICTASIEDKVPPFLKGTGQGWVTAEYGMLPRSTHARSLRDSTRGRITGRTHEIQRLIGRSLRAVVDLEALGERTIWLDCDVIQADGGTRTAAITGGYVALVDALHYLVQKGQLEVMPLTDFVAAVSVGIVDGNLLLDLCYEEDRNAQVDMNIVMTGRGKLIELQGTAEQEPFSHESMSDLVDMAGQGILQLIEKQKQVLGDLAAKVGVHETKAGSRHQE